MLDFMPKEVRWSISTDGLAYEDLPAQHPWGDALEPNSLQTVIPVRLEQPGMEARFARMTLINAGPCPSWHDAATEPSWLFVDEFIVETPRQ